MDLEKILNSHYIKQITILRENSLKLGKHYYGITDERSITFLLEIIDNIPNPLKIGRDARIGVDEVKAISKYFSNLIYAAYCSRIKFKLNDEKMRWMNDFNDFALAIVERERKNISEERYLKLKGHILLHKSHSNLLYSRILNHKDDRRKYLKKALKDVNSILKSNINNPRELFSYLLQKEIILNDFINLENKNEKFLWERIEVSKKKIDTYPLFKDKSLFNYYVSSFLVVANSYKELYRLNHDKELLLKAIEYYKKSADSSNIITYIKKRMVDIGKCYEELAFNEGKQDYLIKALRIFNSLKKNIDGKRDRHYQKKIYYHLDLLNEGLREFKL